MKKGFTLIELLVVVAIISLLSSVVLASLASARLRARDSAIVQSVNQMRIVIESDRTDYGNYAHPNVGVWFSDNAGCQSTQPTSSFTVFGSRAKEMANICSTIIKNSDVNGWVGSGYILYLGNQFDTTNRYSVMAYLPGKKAYYCVGSGGVSDTLDATRYASVNWAELGCYSNP
ncbi:MAG: type II secretion system protein [Patescibacteria group bacterium]